MDKLLNALENEDVRKIIMATYINPKSANELSFKLGISISRCYQLLRKLECLGLMKSYYSLNTNKGRPKKRYQARLRNPRMVVEDDRIMIQFELPHDIRHVHVTELLT